MVRIELIVSPLHKVSRCPEVFMTNAMTITKRTSRAGGIDMPRCVTVFLSYSTPPLTGKNRMKIMRRSTILAVPNSSVQPPAPSEHLLVFTKNTYLEKNRSGSQSISNNSLHLESESVSQAVKPSPSISRLVERYFPLVRNHHLANRSKMSLLLWRSCSLRASSFVRVVVKLGGGWPFWRTSSQ